MLIIKYNINKKNDKTKKENQSQMKEQETIKNEKEIMIHNSQELNDMPYELALRFDNRTYCEYYCSLIKTKNVLIFSFFYNGDYNSKIVKIDLFFVSFVIFFTVNTLFLLIKHCTKYMKIKENFKYYIKYPK